MLAYNNGTPYHIGIDFVNDSDFMDKMKEGTEKFAEFIRAEHYKRHNQTNLTKENNDDEFIQYFLVNQDLKMGKGKVAAQVAHAATIAAVRATLVQDENFKYWYHSIQKKIILKAPQYLLEECEAAGWIAIRDKGFTQIPANSLTVVATGVVKRGAANAIVKELPLL